ESVGWRAAFYIAGGPGVLLALLTLLIVEPPRTQSAKSAVKDVAAAPPVSPYKSLLREPVYLYAVAGYALQTFALGGFTNWAPRFLERKFSMSLKVANFWFGAVAVVTGFAGTAMGGAIADRMKGDRVRACLRICAWSSVVAAPLALVTVIAPTPLTFFVAIAL